MEIKTKQWSAGSGSATIQYDGQGDGEIIITSDANSLYEARSMQITVETTNGSPKQTKTITINQAAKQRIDLSAAVVTASNQTYSGSAKTPTPTVTLNGSTVPSSGYDVAYSNNTNAGTAIITITGKGDYTGTAYGTFTIAKASRTLSFADTYMVLNTSSTGTKTATPSAGSGDGAITYSIANTTYATINSSTGAVTAKTSDGSVVVTATIAAGTNYKSASASYTLYVFATTHDYSYSGSAKDVTLPPGTYKLECWGAQGGSNGTNSTYSITAKAGGKGGYSVGQLTIAQALAIQVLVGGQGSASAAGYNGGGSTTGTSQYDSGDTFGYSKMGGGGGATDIRLSDGALLSRMIVAGGGSGGAMCYRQQIETITSWETVGTCNVETSNYSDDSTQKMDWNKTVGSYTSIFTGWYQSANSKYIGCISPYSPDNWLNLSAGDIIRITCSTGISKVSVGGRLNAVSMDMTNYKGNNGTSVQWTVSTPSTSVGLLIMIESTSKFSGTVTVEKQVSSSSTTTGTDYQAGFAGGGTSGAGYSSTYQGKQNAAGSGGSFGQGATQTATNYRYCSAAGGGGWYGGGGGQKSDSSMTYVHYSGGGSGWVNIAANAGNRPSGYTGLELDSGTTYAGTSSFPSTGGGTETGHSGNGYVRITRL